MRLEIKPLIYFLYSILPFVSINFIYNGSIVPKYFIIGLLFILVFLYSLSNMVKENLSFSRLYIFLLLFLIALLLSVSSSTYILPSIFSILKISCFFIFIFLIPFTGIDKNILYRIFGIQSLIMMLIMISQVYHGKIAAGTLGNSGWATSFILITSLCGLSTLDLKNKKARPLFIADVLIFLLWMFFYHNNRAFLITLCFIPFVYIFNRQKKLSYIAVFSAILIILISSLLLIPKIRSKYSSINYRIMLWEIGLNNFKNNPLLGTGPGTFALIATYKQFEYGKNIKNFLFLKTNITHAHNEFIETLSETGITGSIILLLFIFLILKKSLHTPEFIILFSILIYSSFWFPFHLPVQSLYISQIISFVLISEPKKYSIKISKRALYVLGPLIVSVITFVFIFPAISEYYYAKGEKSKFSGNIKSAFNSYRNSILFNPINDRALTGEAFCLHNMSRYNESNNLLDKALKIKPSRDIFYLSGMNYYFLKDYTNTYKNLKMAALL